MQDVIDGVVQQFAVVADDDGGVRVLPQPRFQPQRALQVEVVGRLVEQQQVGRGEQRGGQRHPHPPAAGKLGHRAAEVGVGEPQAGQDFGRAARRPVGVDLDQAVVDVAQLFRLGGIETGQQRRAFHIGREHGFEQGNRGRRMFLVHRADSRGLRQADVARTMAQLAQDQFEERRFSHAVAADKADLRILGQGDGGLVEEPAAPGVENEVFDLQHRSSNWARTSARRICGWDGWAKNLAPRQRLTGRLHSRPTRARHAEGLEVWPWAP